ncbi:MAG: type II restriction endonuclease, partial [Bacteroidaceae bacterium]
FAKVSKNVDAIKLKLCQLNYLLGAKDLKKSIVNIFNENPKTFSVLDILIAVRKRDKKKTFNKKLEVVLVTSYYDDPDLIYEYIVETGLEEGFKNKHITNLVDYVFGVEVGLDTNARKNRGGTLMEAVVSKKFAEAELDFTEQVSSTDFLSLTSLGEDIKRFDFAVRKGNKTYLIETNFYNGGGSKLNEVCRAYTDLAPKINQYENFEFVWITDGKGWLSAKNKLEEAFNNIPRVYNLTSLKEFIEEIKND